MTDNIQLVIDPEKGAVTLSSRSRNLEIDEFLTDQNGLLVKVLNEEAQKTLSKFLLDNLLKGS